MMEKPKPYINWWQSLSGPERFELMKSHGIKQVNHKLINRMYRLYIYEEI